MFGEPVWNLFLDDLRNPDSAAFKEEMGNINYGTDEWVVCRSTEEALKEIAVRGFPAYMSLDHDLGGDDTTMVFLRRLIDDYWVGEFPPNYIVHSQNPVGRDNIISFMDSWAKATNTVSTNVATFATIPGFAGAGMGFAPVGTVAAVPSVAAAPSQKKKRNRKKIK